jgi:hypothetical protein
MLEHEQLEHEQLLEEYLSSLNDMERKAYNIAVSKLESSFSLEKSIGFITWKKQNNKDN